MRAWLRCQRALQRQRVTELERAGRVARRGTRAQRRELSLRARYAVGCDGATACASHRRRLADRGFRFDWLVADVVLERRAPRR